MPEGFNRFLGFEETMQTQDCRQISNVEKLSGGDYDVTVTYTADEQTVKLLLNFKKRQTAGESRRCAGDNTEA